MNFKKLSNLKYKKIFKKNINFPYYKLQSRLDYFRIHYKNFLNAFRNKKMRK